MSDEKIFYVYMISRPDGTPCYIGKGCGKRWKKHAWKSTNPHLANIYAKNGGDLPRRKIMEGLSEDEAFELEKFLISFIGREIHGGPLVNLTDGGEGSSGLVHTEENREFFRRLHTGNKYRKGCITSPESRELQRQAKLGQTLADEHRKKIGESLKGRQKSPEECAAISAGKLGKKASDETKAILKASNRSRDPEVRERIRQATIVAMNRPDVKEKVSAASRGRRHSPETIAKRAESLRKAFADPETKKRLSEALKASWARRKAAQQGIEDEN